MKRRKVFLKATILVLVFILALVPLTSCGAGVTEAKDVITSFCEALEAGDTARAASLFHPSYELREEEVIQVIQAIETEYDICFTNGITIVLFREPSIYYGLNFPKGLICEVSIVLDIIVDGKLLSASIVVIDSEGAIGISQFLLSEGNSNDNEESPSTDGSDANNSI